MPFLISMSHFPSDTVNAVWDEMETGSPRARIVVSASFVETHLEHLLRTRLVKDSKVLARVFEESNGALRSFSSKIDVGYLLNIYSADARKELHTIRDIRNDFAHKLNVGPETQSVKDRCAILTLPSKVKVTITPADEEHPLLPQDGVTQFSFASKPDDPLDSFRQACRFYIAMFTMMATHPQWRI
jgi:hypothetical protein